jgi:hypothetical protein
MANDPLRPSTSASRSWTWQPADTLALIAIVLVCLVASIPRWIDYEWMIGYDSSNDFLPDWAYMGQRLRDFELPLWNPYYSSGTPFAGDPGTGWMYLPIMFAFFVFGHILVAYKFLIFLMAAIAGVATYLFARRIGLGVLPACYAAIAFGLGSMLYGMTTDRPAVTTTYLPIIVGLLGAEMALHARRLSAFLGWTALGGIAIAHNFAAWPAQGMIYTLMYVAGWLAWRWVFDPLPDAEGRTATLKRAIAFGLGAGAFAIAFGASAALPLLKVTDQSTIPGGDYSQAVNGQPVGDTNPLLNFYALLLQDSSYYRLSTAAGSVIILALIAIFLFRKHYAVPYFALTGIIFTDIAANESLTRWAFYLVPFFEHAHAHRPTASSAFIFPALNLLAAAGLQLVLDETRFRRIFVAVGLAVATLAGFVAVCEARDIHIGGVPIAISLVTAALVLAYAWRTITSGAIVPGRLPNLLAATLVGCVVLYPTLTDYGRIWFQGHRTPGLQEVATSEEDVEWVLDTIATTEQPGTAAEFLQGRASLQQPFRYAVWYGADTQSGQHQPFIFRRLDPYIVASLVSGPRSAQFRLPQISAYNPVHLKVYSDYLEVMQGREQDYHFVDIFYPALDQSQLFAMLNPRYVIVPTSVWVTPPVAYTGIEVYRDPFVLVYEVPWAFPRAWMVHDVRQASDDWTELELMNEYRIDGKHTALIHGDLPVTSPLPEGKSDSVTVTAAEPESMTLSVTAASDGMVVVSELYADGWVAYVDGKKTDILQTNMALRGIPVTAGSHDVVMRYEPWWLTMTLPVTGVASIGILGIWTWAAVDGHRQRRPVAIP